MADASYMPKIYKKQGATELVVASGGYITIESGGYLAETVQTVSSSADTITAAGVSVITGTSSNPTYLIANPITGVRKLLCISPSSTAATCGAILAGATTAITFGTSVSSGKLTLLGAGALNVSMVGISTATYRVVGVFSSTMAGSIITAAS